MTDKKTSHGEGFLIQGSILAIAGVITKIIGAVYRFPLINILGDTGMGYYGVAFQIYTIALTLTSYSLPLAVSKIISEKKALNEYHNVHMVFQSSMIFAVLSGGFASILIFFGADFISSRLMFMPGSTLALKVLSPCVVIVSILAVLRGYFQGAGSMIPTAISQVVEQVINAALSILGALTLLKIGKGQAAYGAAGGTIGTVAGAFSALVFLLFVYWAYRKTNKTLIQQERSITRDSYKTLIKILLLTLAPIILSSTVSNLCGLIDQALFGKIMSSKGMTVQEYAPYLGIMVGKYDTLINVPVAVSWALASSLIPSLVTTVETGNMRQINQKISVIIRFTMLIAIPCAIGLMVLSRPILDLLFSSENNRIASKMLQLGGLSVVFFCLSTITNAVLQGLNQMMKPVRNAAVALVLHVITVTFMMSVFEWGVYSLVIGNIIFGAAICILNFHDLRMVCNYFQEQRRTFLLPSICSLIMGISAYMVQLIMGIFIHSRMTVLFSVVIAVGVYGGSLMLLGQNKMFRNKKT